MKRLITTTLLSLVCFAANAEWKLLGSVPDKGMRAYVEDTSVRVSGDIAKVWMMYSFETPQEKLQFQSLKAHYSLNCKEDESNYTNELTFRSPDGTGSLLGSKHFPNEQWEPIVPNSFVAIVKKWACSK